uniref:Hemicentin-1 n=1 Tax=Hemiscolopendra marginata TaxID=943146 RepID=A0A646QD31_9MYRI
MGPLCGVGALVPVGRRSGRESLLSLTIALLLALVVVDHVAYGDVTRHEMKVIAGNSLDIPCDIDLNKCGPLYNVKIYKNGNRVFTYDNNTTPPRSNVSGVLERSVGLVKLHIDTDENKVVLHISHVFLVEEGMYRCETTYQTVVESCTTIAFTSVETLAPPTSPQISLDDIYFNMTRIGPFMEGSNITLKCDSTGKPEAKVTWWNGTESTKGLYNFFSDTKETKRGVNIINLVVSRYDLHSRFECQAINEAIDAPLTNWIEVDVEVQPLTIDIIGPEDPILEDSEVTLVCEVTGARPKADITWFSGDTEEEASSKPEIILEENGFTVTTRSTYTFKVDHHKNGLKIRCRASNKVTVAKGEESLVDTYELNVYYAPRVKVVSRLANESGEVDVKDSGSMEMFCLYDANPMKPVNVSWFRNLKLIDFDDASDEDAVDDDYDNEERLYYKKGNINDKDDDESADGEDDDDDDNDDDYDDYPSLVINKILHVDKGEYICRVDNEVGYGLSSTTLKVDVLHPPIMQIDFDPEDIRDDDDVNVTISCELVTGNPHEAVLYRWWKDGVLINETDDDEIELESVDRTHTGNYSCAGENKIGWGPPSKPKRLLVKYQPGQATMKYLPETPIKGKSLNLTCSVDDLGEPPANRYRWYRNDIHLADAGKSQYVIESVSLKTISNFTCTAVNEVGEGLYATKSIEIKAPPSFIETLPEIYGVLENSTNASLSCQIECVPECEIVWFKDERPISGSYFVKNVSLPIDYELNHLPSTLSTLTWPDRQLKRDQDNARYMCKSSGNLVGKSISSETYFQVEFPPEDIDVSDDVVDVLFNTTPAAVTCIANGLPAPNYYWTFGDEEVSAEAELSLNYNIPKEQSGIYTCVAFNKHGNQTATTLINVLYKPECTIDKQIMNDGQVVITCEVSANPTDVFFQWFKDDEPLTDDIYTDELESAVRFQEDEFRYGSYKCIVNNSIGESGPCAIVLTGEGGWLERLAENKAVFVTASVVAGVLLMLIIIIVVIVIVCIVKRRAAAKGGSEGKKKKGEPDNRAFYENLPFHGLQAPPNKPFKPILPDLEYADVDFPAQPMNNNHPYNKAKIVEQILKDVEDDEAGSGDTPMRPPRAKTSTRK